MLSDESNYNIPKDSGVLVEPVVKDVGMIDFNKTKELINSGYEAAKLKIEDIKKLVERRVDSTDLANKRQKFALKSKKIVFKDIYVKGLNSHQEKYLVNAIQSEASGVQLSIKNDREGNFQYVNAIAAPLYIVRNELEGYLNL